MLPELGNRRGAGTPAPFRQRGIVSAVFASGVNLFWTIGTALALFVPVFGLMCARSHPEAPAPQEPPGSGIVVRSEVIVVWMPRFLRDLALHKASAPMAPETLQAYLRRNEWQDAWYALTCRGHQVNGRYAEGTQIRRLREAADHFDELQAVMATAAGSPPRFEDRDFSHARIEVIPDALQRLDPREAITRLLAEEVVRAQSSPARGRDSTPPIE